MQLPETLTDRLPFLLPIEERMAAHFAGRSDPLVSRFTAYSCCKQRTEAAHF